MLQLIESPLLYAGRFFYGPKTTNWRDSSTSIFIRNFSPLCFEMYNPSVSNSPFLKYSDWTKRSNPIEPQISIKLFTGVVGKWQQMRWSFSNLEPQFLSPILALPNHHSGLWVTYCNCSWCLFMGLWVAMQLFCLLSVTLVLWENISLFSHSHFFTTPAIHQQLLKWPSLINYAHYVLLGSNTNHIELNISSLPMLRNRAT